MSYSGITDDLKASLLMTMAAFFWAGTFISGRLGAEEFLPFTFAFLRFSVAAIIAFPLAMLLERGTWKLPLNQLAPVFLIASFGFLGNNVLFLTACRYSSAVNLASIAAACPMMTALLASIWLNEKLDWRRIVGIMFAFAGVILVLFGKDLSRISTISLNPGDIIQTVSIFLLAIYSILSRKVGKNISPVLIVAYGLLFASVMTFPMMIMEHPWNNILEADLKGWISVLYLAMFGSVTAYFFQQIAIKQLGAGRSMAFMNLIPVFSVFLAVLILHEHVSILQIASIALIIFGVSINVRSGAKPPVKGTSVSPSRN